MVVGDAQSLLGCMLICVSVWLCMHRLDYLDYPSLKKQLTFLPGGGKAAGTSLDWGGTPVQMTAQEKEIRIVNAELLKIYCILCGY